MGSVRNQSIGGDLVGKCASLSLMFFRRRRFADDYFQPLLPVQDSHSFRNQTENDQTTRKTCTVMLYGIKGPKIPFRVFKPGLFSEWFCRAFVNLFRNFSLPQP